jgi:phenylacetic acid degradation operon negative regulatory protein
MLHCWIAVSNFRNSVPTGGPSGEEPIETYAERLGMRRFTARSLILSVLLGSHPPRSAVTSLIDFCSLFGVAPGTVRTALSRMVAAGELEPDGHADSGRYRVAGGLLERQRQQDVGRTPPGDDWDGSWWTAVVLADARSLSERRRFRSTMLGAKMGELRPDVWMRPANIDAPRAGRELMVARGVLTDGAAPQLVARLWDLEALDRRARLLLAALDADDADLPRRFIALAACLQYLRTEPQLPRPLAPARTAEELRRRYAPAEARFQGDLATFLRR